MPITTTTGGVFATDGTTSTTDFLWIDDGFYSGSSYHSGTSSTTTTSGVTSGWTITNNQIIIPDNQRIIETPYINIKSPAEQAEIEFNRLHRKALRRARYRVRQDAISKADELLVSNLNKVQRIQYEKFGWFFVESESGKKYRIRKGRQINIDVFENDKIVKRICAHPQVDCPDQDTMLIQKIMLEHQEKEFLNIAHDWAA
jgi:hypothetical protein